MKGFINFLLFLNENYVSIMVIIGLVLAIYQKAKNYISKSKEEKIAIAKTQVKERMLKMITDAEIDFEEWNQAGSIKRSQVIGTIFETYPVLSKSIHQEKLIHWIDDEIKDSLKILKKVVEGNKGE